MTAKKRAASVAALALSGALVLSACSDSEEESNDSTSSSAAESSSTAAESSTTEAESSSTEADEEVEESDATDDADSADKNASASVGDDELKFDGAYAATEHSDRQMSAVYGKLRNVANRDITIVEVKGDLEGARYELHEVDLNGNMSEVGGFKYPAGKEGTFEPGGNHIMIMDTPEDLAAGDTINITLVEQDGTEHQMDNIPVRVLETSHEHYGDGQER